MPSKSKKNNRNRDRDSSDQDDQVEDRIEDWKPQLENGAIGPKKNDYFSLCNFMICQGIDIKNLRKWQKESITKRDQDTQNVDTFIEKFLGAIYETEYRDSSSKESKDLKQTDKNYQDQNEKKNLKNLITDTTLYFVKKGQLYYKNYMQRLEREFTKYLQLTRLFIRFSKKLAKLKSECTDIESLCRLYNIEKKQFQGKARECAKNRYRQDLNDYWVSAIDFYKLAEKMGVLVSHKTRETFYLNEEYGQVDELEFQKLTKKAVDPLSEMQRWKEVKQQEDDNKEDPETEKKHQKIKLENTYINLGEVQYDFNKFTQEHMPKLEFAIVQAIYKSLIFSESNTSLCQIFFSKIEVNNEEGQPKTIYSYQEQVHSSILFEILADLNNIQKEAKIDKNFNDLIVTYSLMHANSNKMISFSKLFELGATIPSYLHIKVDEDNENDEDENTIKPLFSLKQPPKFIDTRKNQNEREIVEQEHNDLVEQMLKFHRGKLLFYLADYAVKSIEDESIIKQYLSKLDTPKAAYDALKDRWEIEKSHMSEFWIKKVLKSKEYFEEGRKRNSFNEDQFLKDLNEHIAIIKMKEKLFNKFRHCLIERNYTIDMFLEHIIGFRDLKTAVLDIKQVGLIFSLVELKFKESQLKDVFYFFSKGQSHMQVKDFIHEVKQFKIGTIAKSSNVQKTFNNKFTGKNSIQDILQFIADRIEKYELADFGTILKGLDYNDDNLIESTHFFQMLKNYISIYNVDGLRDGDLSKIVNHYAKQNNDGLVDITIVAQDLNQFIKQVSFRIELSSKVKNMFEEKIVEETDAQREKRANIRNRSRSKSKDVKIQTVTIPKPNKFDDFILDLMCGIAFQMRTNLIDEFASEKLINTKTKRMAKKEFVEMTRIYCRPLSNFEIEDIDIETNFFRYFIDVQKNEMVKSGEKFQSEEMEEVANTYLTVDSIQKVFEIQLQQDNKKKKQTLMEMCVELIQERIVKEYQKHPVGLLEELQYQNLVDNENRVNKDDFLQQVIGEKSCWRMQYVISENMVTVMEEYYFKKLNKKWIDIEKFISELQKTKDRMNLAIRKEDKQKKYELYLMSKDIPSNKNIEESEEAEPKPDQKEFSLKKPKKEINMQGFKYSKQSDWNTDLKRCLQFYERTIEQMSEDQIDSLTEIMHQTRAIGQCIEAYFKPYGTFNRGQIEITLQSFQLALSKLDLRWAADDIKVEEIFEAMKDPRHQNNQFITPEYVSNAVLACVKESNNLPNFEKNILKRVFDILKKTGMLQRMDDIIKLLNFNRDYSCRINEVIRVFRENFVIDDYTLEDWQIKFLMQRYVHNDECELDEAQDKSSQNVKSFHKSVTEKSSKFLVYFIQFVTELGLLNRGIHPDLLVYVPLADRITKAIELKDHELRSRKEQIKDMEYYLNQAVGNSRKDQYKQTINLDEWHYFLNSIGYVVNEDISRGDANDLLLNVIGVNAQVKQKPTYSRKSSNSRDDNSDDKESKRLEDNEYDLEFDIKQVVKNFRTIYIKSKQTLWQDCLNQLYIESKKHNMSNSITQIFYEVDELRNHQKLGYISSLDFSEMLFQKFRGSQERIDFMHLALKYKDSSSQEDQVFYDQFFIDYKDMESKGLGAKIFGLEDFEYQEKNDGSRLVSEKEDFFNFKISKEQMKFYEKIGGWIKAKDREKGKHNAEKKEELIHKLCKNRSSGFISRDDFYECFRYIGIDLSDRQLSILTYSLHTDLEGKKYSFPELIELIFGQEEWLKTKREYNLNHKTMNSFVDADTSLKQQRIFYSPGFKVCLEYMMDELEVEARLYENNEGLIDKETLFRVMSACGIVIEPNDVRKLNSFAQMFEGKQNEKFTLKEFFHDVSAQDYCKKPKQNLRDQFKNSQVIQEVNRRITLSFYTADDVIKLMKGLNLRWESVLVKYNEIDENTKNSYIALETMFYAIRLLRQDIGTAVEDKPFKFISRDQLLALLKIDKAALNKTFVSKLGDASIKSKPAEQQEVQPEKKRELTTEEKQKVFNSFKKFVLGNYERESVIQDIVRSRISVDEFANFLKKMDYKASEEKFNVLCELFQSQTKKKDNTIIISVARLMHMVGIKEKPKKMPEKEVTKESERMQDGNEQEEAPLPQKDSQPIESEKKEEISQESQKQLDKKNTDTIASTIEHEITPKITIEPLKDAKNAVESPKHDPQESKVQEEKPNLEVAQAAVNPEERMASAPVSNEIEKKSDETKTTKDVDNVKDPEIQNQPVVSKPEEVKEVKQPEIAPQQESKPKAETIQPEIKPDEQKSTAAESKPQEIKPTETKEAKQAHVVEQKPVDSKLLPQESLPATPTPSQPEQIETQSKPEIVKPQPENKPAESQQQLPEIGKEHEKQSEEPEKQGNKVIAETNVADN